MKRFIESVIFNSKWLLIPFYFGLILVLGIYTWVYIKEIYSITRQVNSLTKESAMLWILEIVDICMIANLIKMIITGSYNSFVDKSHGNENEKASSGMLKIKMSTSLIGVSSIHLLQSFINAGETSWPELEKQLLIHFIFLVGAIALSVIEYLHIKGELKEESKEQN